MIQINPLQSYIDGGARAALTTPPSASLVFDLPGKAIWVKGVKLKGIDHTYTFSHDNYITLTNTPDKNNPESEDINIGVNIITLKNAIDTTYNGGTLALLQEGINTEERTWQAKILHNYINNILPTTKNLQINGTNYAIYTTEDSLPQFFAPTSLGTTGQILACTSSGLSWINQIQNTDYRVSQSSATNDNDYRIILKQGADNNPETNFVRFSEYLTFNPSTKILKINNTKVVTATDIYVGATSTANATAGLVPAATSEQQNYYLRGDGTWVNIATEMAAANTWRPIKVENTDVLGSSTDTGALSFTAGTGITLAWDATNKRIIITNSSPDVNHNTDETVRQVPKTDNVNRPLMMINGGTSAGEQINTSMFSTGIYANASTKMITANGFIKAGSSDNYVLLGGGNHKALSDFSMSHEHPYLPIAYTNENQTDDWGKNYAKTHYNSYVYNSSGREWSYWIGMHPSLTYGNILRLSHDGLVQYCHKTGGDKDSNWSSWKNIITSDNFNSYSPTLIGVGASGTWDINISGNAATATLSHYLTVQYCRDDNYPSNKGLWNTIKNGTTNAINNRVRFYTIYGSSANLGAPETYGELLEICSYNSNHWQPQLWFGAGTGGRLYYRNKEYNNDSWGAWRTVAWTSDIPTVTDYYWANVKVSSTSSTIAYPTFGSLSVINDSCNNGNNSLAYFQHRSNNNWTVKIDSGSYDYGLHINASGTHALYVGPGASRFTGAMIIGADATPSYTLDVRGTSGFVGDTTIGSKSIYYQRGTRGAIHHEIIGDDCDYGVMKIRHLSTEGNGGPGSYTASLAIFDERADTITGSYQPTFYINRSGATRTPALIGIDVGGSRKFTIDSSGNLTSIGSSTLGSISANTPFTVSRSYSYTSAFVRFSHGWEKAFTAYDDFILSSYDVATLRICEADGTELGLCGGDGHSTITSSKDLRFYTACSTAGTIYSGASGTWGLTISGGNCTSTNYYTTSDRNKKQNISSFSEHIRKFQLKDTEKWHYGVIAQEVEEMFRDGEEGNMTVNYNSVLSFYIGQLENRVKELEDKLRKYENIL